MYCTLNLQRQVTPCLNTGQPVEYALSILQGIFVYIVAGNPNEEYFASALNTGVLVAPDLVNLIRPGANTVSPYAIYHSDREKEQIFESIRTDNYPDKPRRLGALFLFNDLNAARLANKNWWQGTKNLYSVDVQYKLFEMVCDSKWLDCPKEKWVASAHEYFKGNMTQSPLPEVLFIGSVTLKTEIPDT